jgi:hypothetical protein
MKKDWIPLKLALELKELGFDEPCRRFYFMYLPAPTYSQAFRWFRDKYKLKCCIIPLVCEQGFSDLYESRIHQEKHSILRIGNYKTYEEAELACLKKLIETIR